MQQDKILVTGATGNVGREVVNELAAQGDVANVVAATLDERAAQRIPPGIATTRLVFGDDATYPGAFAGVRKLFLMRPPQITDVQRYIFPIIDHAKAVGVEQIAFLSLLGVENNQQTPHYKVEQYLKHSGVPTTYLRPSFYMQNLNTTHRQEIRDEDRIAVPVGKAKTSFIDVRDIGAVAAKVLRDPGHGNRAYALTGGEALDYYQVAARFTEILGREITYTNPSVVRFVITSLLRGTKLPFALVMAFLYTQTRRGMTDRVTDDVAHLLGRHPIPMRQYIADYADFWKKEA